MHWIFGSIFGSISLVIMNGFLKKLSYSKQSNILIISLLSLISTYCFWYAWRNSEGFLRVWFIQSAMVATGAFILNYLLLKEKIDLIQIVGIILILFGAYLLKTGG